MAEDSDVALRTDSNMGEDVTTPARLAKHEFQYIGTEFEQVCVLLSTINLDEYGPFSLGTLSCLEFLHCLDLTRVINHKHYVPAMSI